MALHGDAEISTCRSLQEGFYASFGNSLVIAFVLIIG